jgi:NitT/TauT family transport system substrate-binding protein
MFTSQGKFSNFGTMKSFAFTLATLLLPLCLAQPAQSRTIRVAIPGHSYVIASVIAKQLGYYREHNLDVELVMMPVGIGVKAIVAENVEFAAMGSGLFSAILGGAPLRIIMSSFRRPLFLLYSAPMLRTLKDLKRKKIGVPALGTAGHSMLLEILRKNGQSSDRDLVLVSIGSTEHRLQALLNGLIDAAVLSPPSTFLAEEAGFYQMVSFVDQDLVFLGGGIGVHEALLDNEPDLVEKFTRATLKGHRYVLNNETGTIPIISRAFDMSESHAKKFYRLIRSAMTPDGTIDPASQEKALAPALRLRGERQRPALRKIFDFSLLRKLNGESSTAPRTPTIRRVRATTKLIDLF